MRSRLLSLLAALSLCASMANASVVLEAASTEYLDYASGALCTSYPFSVSAWMKVVNVDNDMTVWYIGDDGSINNILGSGLSDGDSAANFYQIQVRDPTSSQFADTGAVTANTWVHIGGVFASTTSRTVYPNGGTKEEDTNSVSPGAADTTELGRRGTSSPDKYMDGKIAEVGVWCGTALTDTDMTNLAAGDNPMTVGSPTAYWRLLSDANDGSGNGNNLTPVGAGITFDTADHAPVDAPPGGGFTNWRLLVR